MSKWIESLFSSKAGSDIFHTLIQVGVAYALYQSTSGNPKFAWVVPVLTAMGQVSNPPK